MREKNPINATAVWPSEERHLQKMSGFTFAGGGRVGGRDEAS